MAAGEKRKNIRLSEENVNFRMMNLIRKVHGMIDDPDIEKHRHSQNQVGAFLSNQKDVLITPVKIKDMEAEWICANRVHMKKYPVLPWRRIFNWQQDLCEDTDRQARTVYLHGCALL